MDRKIMFGGLVFVCIVLIAGAFLTLSKSNESHGGTQSDVKIISPRDGDVFESGELIALEVDVKDGSNVKIIEWFLSKNSSGVNIGSGMKILFRARGAEGNHTIKAKVTDSVGNSKTDSVQIIVKSPDLSINYDDVSISPIPIKKGENINITIKVRNIGSLDASNVKVGYYYNNGTLMELKGIDSLSAKSEKELSMVWRLNTDVNRIAIVADPDHMVDESNERNNFVIIYRGGQREDRTFPTEWW